MSAAASVRANQKAAKPDFGPGVGFAGLRLASLSEELLEN